MPNILAPDHELVVGATGTGKSRYILYKILRSMFEGLPLCYIDPKGETYWALLSTLSSTRTGNQLYERLKHRILFFNPLSKSDHILGFNAIEPLSGFSGHNPDLTALVANSLVSHIRRQSGFDVGEANRMQNIMSAAIGTLVEGGRYYTLAEIFYLFQQVVLKGQEPEKQPIINAFARVLLANVQHFGTRLFWEQQWANWNAADRKNWVQSTEGRIFQYLYDERFLYSVCASQNATMDITRVVNEGYWVFVHIPFQFMSETITTILGNILLTKIFHACLQRGMGSIPYRLIVDEARFFNTGPLDTIMETAHNLGLNLTLVVQNLEQLSRTHDGRADYRLRDSIMTNCRYFSAFNCSSKEDKDLLADLMFPITGRLVDGITAGGDYTYIPAVAEQDMHRKFFSTIPKRRVMIYDKMGGEPPKVWVTPDVDITIPERSRIAWFEGEHLRQTGKPVAQIRDEIIDRKKAIMGLLGQEVTPEEARKIGPPMDLER